MQSAEVGIAALRLGARGSPLALAQAAAVRAALTRVHGSGTIAVVPIRTTGDRIRDRPLGEAGGKGLFTKEIDEALLAGRIDAAVHSAKDMPTQLPDGLIIAACLERGDVRDAFISPVAARLAELPQGAVLATSSLRRKALALRARPDLKVVAVRGNVETRLAKVTAGEMDATVLAAAGLARLDLLARASAIMTPEEWLPAVGQGVIAIATRADDRRTIDLLAAIDHAATAIALCVERAFLARLDGSCRTPIGGLAEVDGERVRLRGIIVKPDGSACFAVARSGLTTDAERIGGDAGAELAELGGPDFFAGA